MLEIVPISVSVRHLRACDGQLDWSVGLSVALLCCTVFVKSFAGFKPLYN